MWEKLEGLGFGDDFIGVKKALHEDARCSLILCEVNTDGAKLSIGLK